MTYEPNALLDMAAVARYLGLSDRTIERNLPDLPWTRLGRKKVVLFRLLVAYLERRAAA